MKHYKANVYPDELLTKPTIVDGTGILMANGQWRGIPWTLDEVFADLLKVTGLQAKPEHVMVNTILPGGKSGWHIDPEPARFSRWHLPLTTNDGCFFESDQIIHMPVGFWSGPVKYWERHRVWNSGKTPRTHLIVDLRVK